MKKQVFPGDGVEKGVRPPLWKKPSGIGKSGRAAARGAVLSLR
jgi:hypothetical protein